jgi:signal transduction histidine kinase
MVREASAGPLGLEPRGSATDPGEESSVGEGARSDRLMEMFVAALSHDLRSPLAAISTAVESLAAIDHPSVGKQAERIRYSADRMWRLIDQLLDYTRIRIGEGLPLDADLMDLAALCRLVVGELEISFPERRIVLLSDGDAWGTWDRDRLAQAICNLAGNACLHGEDGAIELVLDGADPDWVTLEVRNRGAIRPEILPSLFEAGRKDDGSPGLGLGMFIAQQIAIAHGGRIDVSSSDARGTRVSLVLPRVAPPVSQVDESTGTFRLPR